ncbi:MAG: hypothetical protein KAS96_05970 [Planctomycetes bacterium]|nr:hypothetical protein [Planctomycetota bacterium]
MKSIVLLIVEFFKLLFKSKQYLMFENLMLRQQLNIYKRENKKPKYKDNTGKIFCIKRLGGADC